MAELADLDRLAEAARPERVVLAWVDRPVQLPARLAGQVDTLPLAEAKSLAQRIGGPGYGLPMAQLTGHGYRNCPVWRHPLRPADITSLRSACR